MLIYRANSAASVSNLKFFGTENELQGELISMRRSSGASNCTQKKLSNSSALSRTPKIWECLIYIYIYIELMCKWYKNLECIPWQISVRPNSPHVSSMNGNRRQGSKISNNSDGNQTSFKNNNSKRNVRIRVISSNTSESRPSWYKSMKMRRLSTATGSTRIETKANLGNRLLRWFLIIFLNFVEKVI